MHANTCSEAMHVSRFLGIGGLCPGSARWLTLEDEEFSKGASPSVENPRKNVDGYAIYESLYEMDGGPTCPPGTSGPKLSCY